MLFHDASGNLGNATAKFMEDPTLQTASYWTGSGVFGGTQGVSFNLTGPSVTYDWPGSTNASGTTVDGWGGALNPQNQSLTFTTKVTASNNPSLPVGSAFTITETAMKGIQSVGVVGTGNDFMVA
jgi:hypothetical protein